MEGPRFLVLEAALRADTNVTTSAPSEYEDNSTAAVKIAIVTNAGWLLLGLVIFELLLKWPSSYRILAPKLAAAEVALPSGVLGWIRKVWADRNKLMDPDALVLVRFHELGFKFSGAGSLLALLLLPMYASGQGNADGFNVYSLSNIAQIKGTQLSGDWWRLWGVVLAAYLLTGFFFWLVIREWTAFKQLRRQHYARSVRGECGSAAAQARRSVMVECVPRQSQSEAAVTAFFQGLLGADSVRCSRMPRPQWEGTTMVAPAEGREVVRLQSAVRLLEDVVGRTSSTAFVTFASAEKCLEIQQVVVDHDGGWVCKEAPEPRDLIWENVNRPLLQVRFRARLMQLANALELLFWAIPVAAVQAWASLDHLKTWLPFVTNLRDYSPTIYNYLTTYLPVLALIGLIQSLPVWFTWVAKSVEGQKTLSEVERSVLSRCFCFQLASLYVTVLSGSVVDSLRQIVDHAGALIDTVATSLPKVNVYFFSYVLALAGSGLPLLLLRPGSFCQCCGGGSEAVVRIAFGSQAATAALVLTICLTYSFIAPTILPACAVYFGLAAVCYRWLFAYVYEPEFESAGAFWYDLFNCVVAGLLLGTLGLVGMVGLKGSYVHSAALGPLPLLVVWFFYHCHRLHSPVSRFVPLLDAVSADEVEEGQGGWTFAAELYADPRSVKGEAGEGPRAAAAADSPRLELSDSAVSSCRDPGEAAAM